MASAPDTATVVAEYEEYEADERDDDADRPQDRNGRDEADEHEDKSDDNHGASFARALHPLNVESGAEDLLTIKIGGCTVPRQGGCSQEDRIMSLLQDAICAGQMWQSSEALCEVIGFGSGGWHVRIVDGFGVGQVVTLPADELRQRYWQPWSRELPVWARQHTIIEPA